MTPCYPSTPGPACDTCARRRDGNPRQPKYRRLVIDASIARAGGSTLCELRIVAIPQPYAAKWALGLGR